MIYTWMSHSRSKCQGIEEKAVVVTNCLQLVLIHFEGDKGSPINGSVVADFDRLC